LRKPGKMRWEYAAPSGKLFISDGKYIYYSDPAEKRAEKMKFKETEDMRAPLAFLLGRLKFDKDFRDFRTVRKGDTTLITAIPKSDTMPYSEVTFLVDSQFAILSLSTRGQDNSVLDFTFSNERRNPQLADRMFVFTPPAGYEYQDSSK